MKNNNHAIIPAGTRLARSVAGLLPPLATWYLTRSVWGALGVFTLGAIAGYLISTGYADAISRGARRNADGEIPAEDFSPILTRALPVFVWAPPVAGAIAAAAFIALHQLA